MASLRLTFPEKDQPTIIALTGARLTIGRLPFNTIQIIDRTVSGFHAELISEHGHYRLHDRGSSNGTYVNGQKISDYHLNEVCTISFGTVEAQFNPEDVKTSEEAETFPSRGEVNAVRQENAEMRATVAALREEIEALRKTRVSSGEEGGATVSREEYERVVVEREGLKEGQLRHEEEIGRLKTDLAILKRDRLNLQLAYDGAQRELEQFRRKASGKEDEAPLPPVQAAAVVAAQADEVRIEMPKPATPAAPVAAPAASPESPAAPEPAPPFEAETVIAPTPVEPAVPLAPAASLEKTPPAAGATPVVVKVPSTLGQMSKPVVPPELMGKTVPIVSVPAPAPGPGATGTPVAVPKPGNGGGTTARPVMRPPLAPRAAPGAPGAKPASPGNVPVPRATAHRPLPPPRQIPQATPKPGTPPAPKGNPAGPGPKGTQKLSE